MGTKITAKLTPFALRTTDRAWIARNRGKVDDDGRVTVLVPADQVEAFKFAGVPHLRHHFADCPRDMANAWIMCPAKWVA
jgi:hypothetical protein